VAIVGDVDLIVPLSVFALEVGMIPVLVATGAESAGLLRALADACPDDWQTETELLENVDFEEIAETRRSAEVELIIGTSRAYRLARKLDVPLVRTGFPVHDRIGGPRMRHIGYSGAIELLDRVSNALIERSQDRSPVGYSYM
jgi:nitrogenase molybdenum-iron protein NifN